MSYIISYIFYTINHNSIGGIKLMDKLTYNIAFLGIVTLETSHDLVMKLDTHWHRYNTVNGL